MPEDGIKPTLRAATLDALRVGGTSLLSKPETFLGTVLDFAGDAESTSVRIFERQCDRDLLGIYAEAAEERSPEAMERAADRATFLLANDRCLRQADARKVACELAFALATFQGIACPESVVQAAVLEVASSAVEGRDDSSEVEELRSELEQSRSREKDLHEEVAQARELMNRLRERLREGLRRSGNGPGATHVTGPSGPCLNPAYLSLDPKERIEQAEALGFKMEGLRWIKAFCWISAALCMVDICLCSGAFSGFRADGSFATNPTLQTVLGLEMIVMAALVVAFIVVGDSIRTFRRSAPASVAWVLCTNVVTSLVFAFILDSMPGVLVDLPAFIAWVALDLVALLACQSYLSKCEELFTL